MDPFTSSHTARGQYSRLWQPDLAVNRYPFPSGMSHLDFRVSGFRLRRVSSIFILWPLRNPGTFVARKWCRPQVAYAFQFAVEDVLKNDRAREIFIELTKAYQQKTAHVMLKENRQARLLADFFRDAFERRLRTLSPGAIRMDERIRR
jgi:hypothetical protein